VLWPDGNRIFDYNLNTNDKIELNAIKLFDEIEIDNPINEKCKRTVCLLDGIKMVEFGYFPKVKVSMQTAKTEITNVIKTLDGEALLKLKEELGLKMCGDRVLARFKWRGDWLKGEISQVNDDWTYDIQFDNSEIGHKNNITFEWVKEENGDKIQKFVIDQTKFKSVFSNLKCKCDCIDTLINCFFNSPEDTMEPKHLFNYIKMLKLDRIGDVERVIKNYGTEIETGKEKISKWLVDNVDYREYLNKRALKKLCKTSSFSKDNIDTVVKCFGDKDGDVSALRFAKYFLE
jgi:hypothetical protein